MTEHMRQQNPQHDGDVLMRLNVDVLAKHMLYEIEHDRLTRIIRRRGARGLRALCGPDLIEPLLKGRYVTDSQTVLAEKTEQHSKGIGRFMLDMVFGVFLRGVLDHLEEGDDAFEDSSLNVSAIICGHPA